MFVPLCAVGPFLLRVALLVVFCTVIGLVGESWGMTPRVADVNVRRK